MWAVAGGPLFPQHGLIDARQRPSTSPDKHPHTPSRHPPLHDPRTRARATTPYIYHPCRDRLDRIETDRVIPALSFQVDEPAPQQGQEDTRREPEAEGTPERGREQGEEIGGFDGELRRPERGDGGEGRQVVPGQDLRVEAVEFDGQGEQLDTRDRAEEGAYAVEGRGQGGVGDVV